MSGASISGSLLLPTVCIVVPAMRTIRRAFRDGGALLGLYKGQYDGADRMTSAGCCSW